MSRPTRTVTRVALLALAVAVVAFVAIVVAAIVRARLDPRTIIDGLARDALAGSGWTLDLAGPLDVRLLPSPAVTAADVTLRHPATAQSIGAGRVVIEVAIAPLLSMTPEVVVSGLQVEGLDAALAIGAGPSATTATGSAGPAPAPVPAARTDPTGAGAGLPAPDTTADANRILLLALVLDAFRADGRVVLVDAGRERTITLGGLALEAAGVGRGRDGNIRFAVQASSSDGPLHLQLAGDARVILDAAAGTLQVNDLHARGQVGPATATAAAAAEPSGVPPPTLPVSLSATRLHWNDARAELQVDGAVAQVGGGTDHPAAPPPAAAGRDPGPGPERLQVRLGGTLATRSATVAAAPPAFTGTLAVTGSPGLLATLRGQPAGTWPAHVDLASGVSVRAGLSGVSVPSGSSQAGASRPGSAAAGADGLQLDLAGLHATADGVTLAGAIGLHWPGDDAGDLPPHLRFELAGPALDLRAAGPGAADGVPTVPGHVAATPAAAGPPGPPGPPGPADASTAPAAEHAGGVPRPPVDLLPALLDQPLDWDGSVELASVDLDDQVHIDGLALRTRRSGHQAVLHATAAQALGGTIELDLLLDHDPAPAAPRWQATLAGDALAAAAVLAAAGIRTDLTGPLDISAALSATGADSDAVLDTLAGTLAVDGGPGALDVRALKRELAAVAVLAGRNASADSWPDRLDYQRLDGQLRIAGAGDLALDLALDNLRIAGRGTYDRRTGGHAWRSTVTVASDHQPRTFIVSEYLTDVAWPVRCSGGGGADIACAVDPDGAREAIRTALTGNTGLRRRLEQKIDTEVPAKYRDAARTLLDLLGRKPAE